MIIINVWGEKGTIETIAGAAALVSTSDMEGFPNTFLEAWASGTPVVSLNIDPDNVIKEKGLGFVSGTTERAASDIRTLFRSPELFDSLSQRARLYAQDAHGEASVVRVFEAAVQRKTFGSQFTGEGYSK